MMRAWVMITVAAVLAACGGDRTVVETPDGTVRQMADGETMTFKGKDGAEAVVATGGAALDAASQEFAAKLPAFAPAYPGAKVVSTMAGTGSGADGGSGMVLVMETTDSLADIAAFYDARIKDAGITSQITATTADSATRMVADEATKTGVMISIADGGDLRTVTLTSGVGG